MRVFILVLALLAIPSKAGALTGTGPLEVGNGSAALKCAERQRLGTVDGATDVSCINLPVFSGLDYGMTCDGSTDDSQELQAAIDDATTSGGVVTIPAGSCAIADVAMKSSVSMSCEGSTFVPFGTPTTGLIASTAEADNWVINGCSFNVDQVTTSALTMKNANSTGILITNSSFFWNKDGDAAADATSSTVLVDLQGSGSFTNNSITSTASASGDVTSLSVVGGIAVSQNTIEKCGNTCVSVNLNNTRFSNNTLTFAAEQAGGVCITGMGVLTTFSSNTIIGFKCTISVTGLYNSFSSNVFNAASIDISLFGGTYNNNSSGVATVQDRLYSGFGINSTPIKNNQFIGLGLKVQNHAETSIGENVISGQLEVEYTGSGAVAVKDLMINNNVINKADASGTDTASILIDRDGPSSVTITGLRIVGNKVGLSSDKPDFCLSAADDSSINLTSAFSAANTYNCTNFGETTLDGTITTPSSCAENGEAPDWTCPDSADGVVSGVVTGTDIILTQVDASTVTIDASGLSGGGSSGPAPMRCICTGAACDGNGGTRQCMGATNANGWDSVAEASEAGTFTKITCSEKNGNSGQTYTAQVYVNGTGSGEEVDFAGDGTGTATISLTVSSGDWLSFGLSATASNASGSSSRLSCVIS